MPGMLMPETNRMICSSCASSNLASAASAESAKSRV
jgi:hypothetical protein